MATYRVSLKGRNFVDKDAARKVIENMLAQEVTRYKNAGIEAMQELRAGAVNAWYGTGNAKSPVIITKSGFSSLTIEATALIAFLS